jgi:2'-5' RNA ligase
VSELRSAVIVAVPEAAAAVDTWRELTCDAKPSIGVPPHVTLLFPFVAPAEIMDDVIGGLRRVFAPSRPFAVELRKLSRFPGILYLAPETAEPFVALTHALVSRFPGYPPYGDASLPVIPHLTVAQGDDELLDRAESEVTRALPIAAEITEALLLEQFEQDGLRWRVRERFRMGSGLAFTHQ